MQDIRYALRSISARPWFAATIVATLALGIGINTAVFSLANSVVLEPLPFPDGDRIVTMANTRQTEPDSRMNVSWLDLEDYRAGTSSFELLEAAIIVGSVLAETSLPPEVVRTGRGSPGLLSSTGVAPVLGRSLQPSDGEPGAPAVVVLSHELWTNRYLAAPDVVGRYVRIDNQSAT